MDLQEKQVCNVTAYKFVTLAKAELPPLSKQLEQTGITYSLKGTILLSTEGINLCLAAVKSDIMRYVNFLKTYPLFENLPLRYTYSDFVPFEQFIVKIREEIVTFRQDDVKPEEFTAPYISPQTLKTWLSQDVDFTLLDARNSFEYNMGTFEKAVQLNITSFSSFPHAFDKADLEKDKPLVTFCTGGIRCEKAAAYLLKQGFKEVYQLQGGILHYFEQCGERYFKGNCFLFDGRIIS
jgi:UPF0176 protein